MAPNNQHPTFIDHYAILGISPTASKGEINSAYKQLARQHHPDKNNNSAESTRKFQQIQDSKDILMDDNKRADYDYEYQERKAAAARAAADARARARAEENRAGAGPSGSSRRPSGQRQAPPSPPHSSSTAGSEDRKARYPRLSGQYVELTTQQQALERRINDLRYEDVVYLSALSYNDAFLRGTADAWSGADARQKEREAAARRRSIRDLEDQVEALKVRRAEISAQMNALLCAQAEADEAAAEEARRRAAEDARRRAYPDASGRGGGHRRSHSPTSFRRAQGLRDHLQRQWDRQLRGYPICRHEPRSWRGNVIEWEDEYCRCCRAELSSGEMEWHCGNPYCDLIGLCGACVDVFEDLEL